MSIASKESKKFGYELRNPFGVWLAILFICLPLLGLYASAARQPASFVAVLLLGLDLVLIHVVFKAKRAAASDPDALELRADRAVLPSASFLGGYTVTRYADIRNIRVVQERDNEVALITAVGGNARVFSRGFSNIQRFREFVELLAIKWKSPASPLSDLKPASPNPVAALSSASASAAQVPGSNDAFEQSLLRTIAERKAQDPFVGAKIAAKEVLARVMNALKDSRGIHLESLFCALGAIAGHACQASVRAQSEAAGRPSNENFQVITTRDGKRYFFGDALNKPLVEDRVSLWNLVAAGVVPADVKNLPDVNEMFAHNAKVVGSEQFGIPRLPPGHAVRATPIKFAAGLWPLVSGPVVKLTGDPKLWPVAIGLAIQEAMSQAKGVLPAGLIVRIVMESAIPVSKIPIEN